jgi:hypothetical protein
MLWNLNATPPKEPVHTKGLILAYVSELLVFSAPALLGEVVEQTLCLKSLDRAENGLSYGHTCPWSAVL